MLKKTPLHNAHAKLNAKFVEFGGWDMPVLYTGVIDEHMAVRDSVGIFDVSHMGEIFVEGIDAFNFLQYVCSNDLSLIEPGKAQYNLLLNNEGGVVDDIIVYLYSREKILLCVNASNTEKDFAWLSSQKKDFSVNLINASKEYAQIAIQGPNARRVLNDLNENQKSRELFAALGYFEFAEDTIEMTTEANEKISIPVIVAATGYTGEDGFEVFLPAQNAEEFWFALIKQGTPYGLKPIGLGARDTLRLEAAYPLHGHELRDDIFALECRVAWAIKFSKDNFIGKQALLDAKQKALIKNQLVGLEVLEAGIIREHIKIFMPQSTHEVGEVSSGTKTPFVNKAIGLAFINKAYTALDTILEAEIRNRRVKVKVVKLPFFKR